VTDGAPFAETAGQWAERLRKQIRLAEQMAQAAGEPVEIATTPKREIWRDGLASLGRYEPMVAEPRLGPALILHGLIGRQTITDLEPDRSLVRRLLEGGTDLYVLDWGSPSRAHRCLDMTDYAEHFLGDAIAAVTRAAKRPRVALIGICQGGVFALCHAAHHPERVAGLAPMVTPVDFHADRHDPDPAHGLLNLWARSIPAATIEAYIDEVGCVPGELTGSIFQLLTPARTAAKYGTDLADLADDGAALTTFLRMERWLADRPDHPGAAAKDWVLRLYRENRLIEGSFMIAGEPVDLGQIECPVLSIAATHDHIVPAPCALALRGLTASRDFRALEVPTGHTGVFVSQKAQALVPPALLAWLGRLDHGPV